MADRYHVVLIPGFGGFDALGQVEYYAHVTSLFDAWKRGRPKRARPVVLHYFDNFPTAAVVTRAARLRSYLAKRIARGEISGGDEVTLVGHSTGGLDIRQLISDLHGPADGPLHVDGGLPVPVRTILRHVRRVVFLSVPHWGTNIADWVRSHPVWRQALVAELQAAVAGSQIYLLDRVEAQIAGCSASLTGAQLLLAAQDALTEANAGFGRRSPLRTADAQEAASELALYLRHMASDFHAIDDLSSQLTLATRQGTRSSRACSGIWLAVVSSNCLRPSSGSISASTAAASPALRQRKIRSQLAANSRLVAMRMPGNSPASAVSLPAERFAVHRFSTASARERNSARASMPPMLPRPTKPMFIRYKLYDACSMLSWKSADVALGGEGRAEFR